MNEIWIEIINKSRRYTAIVALSNTGLIRRRNNTIEVSKLRQQMYYNGKQTRVYRVIAEIFLPKTEEDIKLGRDCIDHITHNPTGMNINDIRNLRWCTKQENINFEEGKKNRSNALKGRTVWLTGKKQPEETKRKISEAKKGTHRIIIDGKIKYVK